MTRFFDYLAGTLTGCLIGVLLMAATMTTKPFDVGRDPTPRPPQHADPGPGTPGMTPDGILPPVPSPDVAAGTEAPGAGSAPPPSTSPTTGTRPAPTRMPRTSSPPRLLPPTFALRGVAVWYDYRRGHAAAGPLLREALGAGWRGTTVRVCSDGRCIRVVLSDFCACQSGRRLVDLDMDSFRQLAPLSRGVIPVEVEW